MCVGVEVGEILWRKEEGWKGREEEEEKGKGRGRIYYYFFLLCREGKEEIRKGEIRKGRGEKNECKY